MWHPHAGQTMNIGSVSQLTGASPKAIRHYEAQGLMPGIARLGTYRTYTQGDVNRVRLIRTAQALGFKLSELSSLTRNGRPLTWRGILGLLDQKHALVRQEMARLAQQEQQLNALRCELQGCLDAGDEEVDLNDVDCELLAQSAPLRSLQPLRRR